MNETLTTGNPVRLLALALCALVLAAPVASAADQPLEARLEGIVSVAVADWMTPDKHGKLTGYSETLYVVRVGEFEFVELAGNPELLSKLKTGERVVLNGQREQPELFRATAIVSREAGPDMTVEKAFLGEQDMAIVPVRFPNVGFPTACQYDVIDSIAFTSSQSLADYWEEASFDKLFFSEISQTFTEVMLPNDYPNDGSCNLQLWTAQAEQILGSEITPYNRRIFVFPSVFTSWCPFGLGQVGHEGLGVTYSWITGCNHPDAYIHELGHNLSLMHAWTPTQEYGDTGDIMGFGGVGVRKLNGPHIDHLDWLPDGEPYFKQLAGIGTYTETLTALGRDYRVEPNQLQVLKVYAPSLGRDLFISYRDDHGMDSTLGGNYKFRTHVHTERNGTESTLIRVLGTQQAYVVGPDGITVSQLSTNPAAGTAQVRVVIETPNDCEEEVPVVSVANTDPVYAGPGGTINYTLDILNQDGFTCLPLDMRVSAALPGVNWSYNSPIEVTATPGETVNPVVSVTSPSNVTGFTYNFSIIVTAPSDVQGEHTVVTQATYRIDRLAPTAPSGLLMTAADPNNVTMVWNASTDTQSGLAYYEILRAPGDNDFSVIGQSPDTEHTDTEAGSNDIFWYLLRAVDNAGNTSN